MYINYQQPLGEQFGFAVTAFTNENDANKKSNQRGTKGKVFIKCLNATGVHWELLAKDNTWDYTTQPEVSHLKVMQHCYENYKLAGAPKEKLEDINRVFKAKVRTAIANNKHYKDNFKYMVGSSNWEQNSGLEYLLERLIEALAYQCSIMVGTHQQPVKLQATRGFREFAENFRDYYGLAPELNYADIENKMTKLLSQYPHFDEWHMIISPVLRLMVSQDLNRTLTIDELISLYDRFQMAFQTYMPRTNELTTEYDVITRATDGESYCQLAQFVQIDDVWHQLENAARVALIQNITTRYTKPCAFTSKSSTSEPMLLGRESLKDKIGSMILNDMVFVHDQKQKLNHEIVFNKQNIPKQFSPLLVAIANNKPWQVKELLEQQYSPTLKCFWQPGLIINKEYASSLPRSINAIELAAITNNRTIASILIKHLKRQQNHIALGGALNCARICGNVDVYYAFLIHGLGQFTTQDFAFALKQQDLELAYQLVQFDALDKMEGFLEQPIIDALQELYQQVDAESMTKLIQFTILQRYECLLAVLFKEPEQQDKLLITAEQLDAIKQKYTRTQTSLFKLLLQGAKYAYQHVEHTFARQAISANIDAILEIIAEDACDAIDKGRKKQLIDAINVDEQVLVTSGRLNPLHHAYYHKKMNLVTQALTDIATKKQVGNRRVSVAKKNAIKESVKEYQLQLFEIAIDRYGKTLAYRISRDEYKHKLQDRFWLTNSWFEKLASGIMLVKALSYDAIVFTKDWYTVKNKHSDRLKKTKLYRYGSTALLTMANLPILASAGPFQFVINVAASTYVLPKLKETVVGVAGDAAYYGAVGANFATHWSTGDDSYAVNPNMAKYYAVQGINWGFDIATAYSMPKYYFTSAGISTVAYAALKDSGQDTFETLCYLGGDAVGYAYQYGAGGIGIIDDRFAMRLEQNISPILGGQTASALAPSIVNTCRAYNHFIKVAQYPFDAVAPFLSARFQPYIEAAQAQGNQFAAMLPNSVTLFAQDSAAKLNELQALAQNCKLSIINGIERIGLSYLDDSAFKLERVHAIAQFDAFWQHYYQNIFQKNLDEAQAALAHAEAMLDSIKGQINELGDDDVLQANLIMAKNLVRGHQQERDNAKTQLDQQNTLCAEAEQREEIAFIKTTGYQYYSDWQEKYGEWKAAEFNPDLTETQKSALKRAAEVAQHQSEWHNSDAVNQGAKAWCEFVDSVFEKSKGNFVSTSIPWVLAIESMNIVWDHIGTREEKAQRGADHLIQRLYPLFPHVGDATEIEAQRAQIYDDLLNHKLNGYDGKSRQRSRCQRRLEDYFLAKLTNTPEHSHKHRWEKLLSSLGNAGAQPNTQFNWNFGGSGRGLSADFNLGQHVVYRAYGSNSAKAENFEFKISRTPVASSTAANTHPEPQAFNAADKPLNGIDLDNTYIESILAEQYEALWGSNSQIVNMDNAKVAKKTMVAADWLELWGRSIVGDMSPEVIAWKQNNWDAAKNTAGYVSKVSKEINTIPVSRRLSLLGRAAGEVVLELYEAGVDLSKFTLAEGQRAYKGEDLESIRFMKLAKTFMSEEAARLLAKEETATSQYIRELANQFDELSAEDKFVAIAKIPISIRVPGSAAKVAKLPFKSISGIAKKAGNAGKLAQATKPTNPLTYIYTAHKLKNGLQGGAKSIGKSTGKGLVLSQATKPLALPATKANPSKALQMPATKAQARKTPKPAPVQSEYQLRARSGAAAVGGVGAGQQAVNSMSQGYDLRPRGAISTSYTQQQHFGGIVRPGAEQLSSIGAEANSPGFLRAYEKSLGFHPSSVGAARIYTLHEQMKLLNLPLTGEIPFEPTKYSKRTRQVELYPGGTSIKKSFRDVHDNEWCQGPVRRGSAVKGELWEWDVQLSKKGKKVYAPIYKAKFPHKNYNKVNHLNVSFQGILTH